MKETGIKEIVIKEIIELAQKYDIIDMDKTVQAELRKSIEAEGVVIYEKSRNNVAHAYYRDRMELVASIL